MTHAQMLTAARNRAAPLRAAHLATRAQVQARRERRARELRRVAFGVGSGLLLGLLLALALAGCAPHYDFPQDPVRGPAVELPPVEAVRLTVVLGEGYRDRSVFRFDDPDTDSVCYLLMNNSGFPTSISCVTGASGD